MNRCYPPGRSLSVGIAAALLVAAVTPTIAPGAERVVLCEMWTQIGCPHCALAGPAMETMLATYPGELVCLQYHLGDQYANSAAYSRASLYGVYGTPWCVFDGIEHCIGASTEHGAYNCYESALSATQSAYCDTELNMTAVEISANVYRVSVQVCVDPNDIDTAYPRELHIAQALDNTPTGSHWRYTFIQNVSPMMTSITPGDCAVYSANFTITGESLSRPADLAFFAWVQPIGSPAKRVLQSHMIAWPFDPDCNTNGVGDPDEIASGMAEDCNTNGMPDACDISSGYSVDDNGNGVPDECEAAPVCPGDANCDGFVNFRDIDFFVAAQNDNVARWAGLFDAPPTCPFENNDLNGDGYVDYRDIDPLVALQNTTCE